MWVPNAMHQEFHFALKEGTEHSYAIDGGVLTPEQRTMAEWASGRYYQKWCGDYFRPKALEFENAVHHHHVATHP